MAERQLNIGTSSQVKSAAYDDETQTLAIEFNSGGTYHYHGVSGQTADGLESADSPGGYLHAYVKKQHQYTKIG